MKIRALIIDDMPLARKRVRLLLEQDSEIEIAGECIDGVEAVQAIKQIQPDLVFLDMQMPEMSGFEVIETVGVEQMPTVIFVTAYDRFALRAFEVNAFDYLLKPFEEDRFTKSVERAKKQIRQTTRGDFDERLLHLLGEVKNKPDYLKWLVIKTSDYTTLVPTEDIDWISAAGNYLEVHAEKNLYLLRERLGRLEQKLDPEKFVRIHRSTIVALDRVKTLYPMFHGDHIILLKDGTKLNMSRTYYEKLFALLSK